MQTRPQTIFRIIKSKDNPYVMVDRRPIDNPALSFKAKGILTYLLSRPDDWEVNITDLCRHSTDGAAAIRSALHELMRAGHVRYNTQRKKTGAFQKWVIEVYEKPLPPETPLDENRDVASPEPLRDYPQVEKPQVENRTQVINDSTNTEFTNRGAEKAPARQPRMDVIAWEEQKAKMAAQREAETGIKADLLDRFNAYPAECRFTLMWLQDCYQWPASLIPVRGRNKKRNAEYGFWLDSLRRINALLEGVTDKNAVLSAAAKKLEDVTVSSPASMVKTVGWAVGQHARKQATQAQRSQKQSEPTAYERALLRRQQRQRQNVPTA